MIKKTTVFIFLLMAIVVAAMSQTNALRPEVKISGEITPLKSDVVFPEFPKLNDSGAGMPSPLFPDFDRSFRLPKSTPLFPFPSTKQLTASGKSFSYAGFVTHNPSTFDFDHAQTDRLSSLFFIFSNGQKVTHAGLGEFIQLSSSFGWQPAKKLTIAVGGLVGRQFAFATLNQHDIMGTSLKTSYDITDKVQFNNWGLYINSGEGTTLAGFNTLFPHSGIGSSVSVKIKNLSKIEGGVEYQYNESTKVWNLESQGRISLHF